MLGVNGLIHHLLINAIYWGYNPLIFTILPKLPSKGTSFRRCVKRLEPQNFPQLTRHFGIVVYTDLLPQKLTLQWKNPPFHDAFPIENRVFPMSC